MNILESEDLLLGEKCSKSFSLWLMRVMYRWMTSNNKFSARIYAIGRIKQLKATGDREDLKIAEMWKEFFDWTLTYKG